MRLVIAAAIALSSVAAGHSAAQQYPAKPVTFVVTFAAGGTTDAAARLLADKLDRDWKQRVLIENRPGGVQWVGLSYVMRAAPDGYTLVIASDSAAMDQVLNKSVNYDIRRELTPIIPILGSGLVLASPPSLPVKTLTEWLNYAKANPGKINWATTGSLHPKLLQLIDRYGLKVTNIPYKSGAQGMQAVATGDAHIFAGSPLDGLELSKAGRVRPLAYTGTKRNPLYPDLPVVQAELGFPFEYTFTFASWGPPKLPTDIVGRVHSAIAAAVKSPEVSQKYDQLGFFDRYDDTPAQFAERVDAQVKLTESLVAKGILTPQ